jgi:hypothetical protein
MGLDSAVLDGEMVIFGPTFGPATVVSPPTPIKGTGKATVNGKKICVMGDEKKVKAENCVYSVAGYAAPGTGTIEIYMLAPDQLTTKTTNGGKKMILKGSDCIAIFTPKVKAKVAVAPTVVEDPIPFYAGKGKFMTTNLTHKAT